MFSPTNLPFFLFLITPGREHEFTGKKHQFFPVEDVDMQGTKL
jgi:hypothetical protein